VADHRQLCTFFLGNHYFGIDVLKVQEIIRYQPMTRVPLAPPVIRGLINLRGQIVTAIDLRRRLELPDRDSDALPVNVVIHTDDGAVSLQDRLLLILDTERAVNLAADDRRGDPPKH
jgi:purine-binding chemotaxis protein CheW